MNKKEIIEFFKKCNENYTINNTKRNYNMYKEIKRLIISKGKLINSTDYICNTKDMRNLPDAINYFINDDRYDAYYSFGICYLDNLKILYENDDDGEFRITGFNETIEGDANGYFMCYNPLIYFEEEYMIGIEFNYDLYHYQITLFPNIDYKNPVIQKYIMELTL